MTETIYFDHAATTPVRPEVAAVLSDIYKNGPHGNPSSIHRAGRSAKQLVDEARKVIARSIGAKPSEIIFTSGGTESDNTALISAAEAMAERGKHIISTKVEHEAVLEPLKYLESRGFEVTYLDVDESGQISLDELKQALRPETILVSIMLVNNEVGTIFPLAEIAQIIGEQEILLHTDAVQAFGKIDIDVDELGVDYLSISGHKIGGPKGIGVLYERSSHNLNPYMKGGAQEQGRRGGTHNVPGIWGLKKAAELSMDELSQNKQNLESLKQYLLDQLENKAIDFKLNGSSEQSAPHVINLYLPGQQADQLLIRLDLAGICVSTGSACTAGVPEPSHVLKAMYGEDAAELESSLRLSFGPENTKDDIDYLVATLEKIMK